MFLKMAITIEPVFVQFRYEQPRLKYMRPPAAEGTKFVSKSFSSSGDPDGITSLGVKVPSLLSKNRQIRPNTTRLVDG